MHNKRWADYCWDAWCLFSIIGIWPRFIEPTLLTTTHIPLTIPNLPFSLEGLTILQLSDLHWHAQFSTRFKQKIIQRVNQLNPDLIVFTGDFLIRSQLEDPVGLSDFLCSLKAKKGCFAVLGNHDYEQYVTVNHSGEHDWEELGDAINLQKGFKRLFGSIKVTGEVTARAKSTQMHAQLVDLVEKTPFQLLHNSTKMITHQKSAINICGLGEYSLGRCLAKQAFEDYQTEYPGIVLTHNPDSIPELLSYPGDLILAGHTHGGQVNLPIMREKFIQIEQIQWMRGLKKANEKWIYTNRGIGVVMPFRWFSAPELTLFSLKRGV